MSRSASCLRNEAWVTATRAACCEASSPNQRAASPTRATSSAGGCARRRLRSRARPPTATAHPTSGSRSLPSWGLSRASSRKSGDVTIGRPGANSNAEARARFASLDRTRPALLASSRRCSGARSSPEIPAASYSSRQARKPLAVIQPLWTCDERAWRMRASRHCGAMGALGLARFMNFFDRDDGEPAHATQGWCDTTKMAGGRVAEAPVVGPRQVAGRVRGPAPDR